MSLTPYETALRASLGAPGLVLGQNEQGALVGLNEHEIFQGVALGSMAHSRAVDYVVLPAMLRSTACQSPHDPAWLAVDLTGVTMRAALVPVCVATSRPFFDLDPWNATGMGCEPLRHTPIDQLPALARQLLALSGSGEVPYFTAPRVGVAGHPQYGAAVDFLAALLQMVQSGELRHLGSRSLPLVADILSHVRGCTTEEETRRFGLKRLFFARGLGSVWEGVSAETLSQMGRAVAWLQEPAMRGFFADTARPRFTRELLTRPGTSPRIVLSAPLFRLAEGSFAFASLMSRFIMGPIGGAVHPDGLLAYLPDADRMGMPDFVDRVTRGNGQLGVIFHYTDPDRLHAAFGADGAERLMSTVATHVVFPTHADPTYYAELFGSREDGTVAPHVRQYFADALDARTVPEGHALVVRAALRAGGYWTDRVRLAAPVRTEATPEGQAQMAGLSQSPSRVLRSLGLMLQSGSTEGTTFGAEARADVVADQEALLLLCSSAVPALRMLGLSLSQAD